MGWGAIAGGLLGPVIGGLFGKSGQESANRMNYKIAKENREWQERMSNTAYTRAAADLENAGLNRILALGSPASTPAGNIATMQNENTQLAEGIKAGTAQALATRKVNAEIRGINARTALTNAQTNAIAPAATIGEVIVKAKERLSNISDWQSMRDQLGRDVSTASDAAQQFFKRQGELGAAARKETRERISRAAERFGIRGHRGEALLLQTVKQMDLPPMTDAQYLEWAVNNPEKIAEFLNRQR